LAVESPVLHLPQRYLLMVQAILRTHLPEAEIWAYGSRVNGDFHEASDLDLVARQPDDLTHRQTRLYDAIEAFSESNLPIIVQIVDWAIIPVEFRNEIAANHVIITTAQNTPSERGRV
jgi:predicted nucleotidyltransferase